MITLVVSVVPKADSSMISEKGRLRSPARVAEAGVDFTLTWSLPADQLQGQSSTRVASHCTLQKCPSPDLPIVPSSVLSCAGGERSSECRALSQTLLESRARIP